MSRYHKCPLSAPHMSSILQFCTKRRTVTISKSQIPTNSIAAASSSARPLQEERGAETRKQGALSFGHRCGASEQGSTIPILAPNVLPTPTQIEAETLASLPRTRHNPPSRLPSGELVPRPKWRRAAPPSCPRPPATRAPCTCRPGSDDCTTGAACSPGASPRAAGASPPQTAPSPRTSAHTRQVARHVSTVLGASRRRPHTRIGSSIGRVGGCLQNSGFSTDLGQ